MRHLTKGQLHLELSRRPGLVPIGIDPYKRQLEWSDLGTYHIYEGFFHKGLNRFAALKRMVGGHTPESFVTDLDVLQDQQVVVDPIYPTGFIFHAGRCGSTLLTRILARDKRHLVIGEAAAHNQVWLALTKNGEVALTATEENKQFYKHLVLAMGRKRLREHAAHFIKFTSFNILFFNFIRSVFPEVPAIFIYRQPLDILASFAKNPPGWFDPNQRTLQQLLARTTLNGSEAENAFDSPARAVTAFLAAGLGAGKNGVRYLNYLNLNAANLPVIMQALNVGVTDDQLMTMQSQFAYDSKDENRAAKFIVSAERPAPPAIDDRSKTALNQLYEQLVQSELNVATSCLP